MRCATIALAALLAAACISAARGEAAVTASALALVASQPDRLAHPAGNGFIGVRNQREDALFRAIAGGILAASGDILANRTLPEPSAAVAAAAALPVPNATAAEVGVAIANVLAAAISYGSSSQQELLNTLGDPKVWKYAWIDSGDKRVALYKFPVKGIQAKCTCVFVHGCKHDPYSWFYRSPKCPLCTGLPEEVSHSKQCLASGCAVLALMSLERDYRSRCFSSSDSNGFRNDQPSALALIEDWARGNNMMGLPMYMFGISSGAGFATKFPRIVNSQKSKIKLDGIISEVNMVPLESWGVLDKSLQKFVMKYPATVFYQMLRDPKTAKDIGRAVKVFKANNIPVGVIEVPERAVDATFFYNRSMYLSADQSKQIYDALVAIGLINPKTNLIYEGKDPRFKSGWTKKLAGRLRWLKQDYFYNLVSDESQIWQPLNLAYSQHEIVSDYVRATLEWLFAKGKANLTALVDQYDLHGNLRCLTERAPGCPATRRL